MRLPPAARDLVTLIRRHRLTYATFNNACTAARRHLALSRPRHGRQLPKLLTEGQLSSFFAVVDRSDNVQHQIMLRLLLYTGVRVSELTGIRVDDVDLTAGKIFIKSGKGDKDRYVLFKPGFEITLRAYLARHEGEHLFESQMRKRYSERRIEQIVTEYAKAAGIEKGKVHPHLFRHQCLTYLTGQGLTDAQIQLVSGHASKKSLEVYQHLGLGEVVGDYREAMKKMGV